MVIEFLILLEKVTFELLSNDKDLEINLNICIILSSLFYCTGDVFAVIAPNEKNENVKYYLMCCTERQMKLLEDYNDHGFP